MTRRSHRALSLGAIFAAPVALFVLSLVGLIGALLEDGAWDWIGSALLATAVAAVVWARLFRSRS